MDESSCTTFGGTWPGRIDLTPGSGLYALNVVSDSPESSEDEVVRLTRSTIFVNGEVVKLTPREASMFEKFLSNPGQVLTLSQLGVRDKTMIAHLRRKLPAHFIESVRGRGYRFVGSCSNLVD